MTPEIPNFLVAVSVAVFAKPGSGASVLDLVLVDLEADTHESATAQASACGYRYCGNISIKNAVPSVECEPGAWPVMIYAGEALAGQLGERMKQYQLGRASAPPSDLSLRN